MKLYERLLREAAELPEDPNRERNERMSAYLRNLRRPVLEGGGYVTKEELEQEQERCLTDIRKLRALLIRGPSSMAGGTGWHTSRGDTLRSMPTSGTSGTTGIGFESRI